MQNGLSTKMRHIFVLVAAISVVALFFQNCGEEFDNSEYSSGSNTLPGDDDVDEGGDETIPPPPDVPDPIGDLPVFFQSVVATGNEHACGLTTADTVACWGRNNGGKLGNNATTASSLPVTTLNLAGAKAVSIGANHSCAITAQDKVMCWGTGTDGRLGHNSTTGSRIPVEVVDLTGVTAISSGHFHTCAIAAQGTVKCWGRNNRGQLGNGTRVNSPVPVQVTGLTGVKAISSGFAHTCAITAQNTVRCWGWNHGLQLGHMTGAAIDSPTPLSNIANLSGVTAISSGEAHTCAIIAQGAVRCWGRNLEGQLGNNVTVGGAQLLQVVQGLTGAKSITTGRFNACVVTAQDTVRCWGLNDYGQLGNGNNVNAKVPSIAVPNLTGVRAVSAGYRHTCAVTNQNVANCWGLNDYGQLGNGTTTSSLAPVKVGP